MADPAIGATQLPPARRPDDRLRVVFFGRSDYFAEGFLGAIGRNHDVVGAVEAHFGRAVGPTAWAAWLGRLCGRFALREHCRRRAIPYVYLGHGRRVALPDWLRRRAPDVGCIASLPQLLNEETIAVFPSGVINYHPAPLPNYRGPCPTLWQYYFEETQSAATLHFIDSGEDTGDIIAQQSFPIAFGQSAGEFDACGARLGAALLAKALDAVASGNVTRTPQRHVPCAFRARFPVPGEALVDWETWSIERVYHVLRGAHPAFGLIPTPRFPYAWLRWRVVRLTKVAPTADVRPGTFGYAGGRVWLWHRQGRLWLEPQYSLRHALGQARRLIRPTR